MFPSGETFDRSVFMDIVLDSFKKKSPEFPVGIEKRATFCLRITAVYFWLFGYLKGMLERSSFETVENLQEKVTYILMVITTATFRASFEEWKSRLLRCIEVSGEYLQKYHFSTIYVPHKRRQALEQDLPHHLYLFDLGKVN
jgi:hypothetical protein